MGAVCCYPYTVYSQQPHLLRNLQSEYSREHLQPLPSDPGSDHSRRARTVKTQPHPRHRCCCACMLHALHACHCKPRPNSRWPSAVQAAYPAAQLKAAVSGAWGRLGPEGLLRSCLKCSPVLPARGAQVLDLRTP